MQVHAELHQHSNPSERVVVTGQGVVSSLGQDSETFYRNLLEARLTSSWSLPDCSPVFATEISALSASAKSMARQIISTQIKTSF